MFLTKNNIWNMNPGKKDPSIWIHADFESTDIPAVDPHQKTMFVCTPKAVGQNILGESIFWKLKFGRTWIGWIF